MEHGTGEESEEEMKDLKTLDSMTLWNITVNEGALTMIVLGIVFLLLAVGCVVIDIHCKIKFAIRR